MEVVIDWSSSCGLVSDTRKRMQQMVSRANVPRTMASATQLTAPEKRELEWESRWEKWRLEFQQLLRNIISESDGEVTVADKESSFASPVEEVDLQYEARRQQSEARFHERRADTDPQAFIPLPQVEGQGFDSLVSHDGGLDVHQTMATADLDSSSRESHVRAEAEHRSCSTDLDPTDCDLSPMQKTEEHKVRGIDSESYFLSFSHDSMNTFVGNSTGVSELSTMGDDSLIEQHSNIVEEESTMSLKDAIAIYVEEFVNSRNSSMKFDVAARASFDVKAEGLVDEEEKEVSKEVSMGESLCRCKGVDGKYVQMDRTFDAFLFLDPIKVPVSSQIELAKVPMTNRMKVQNPSKCGWSMPNWFAMPKAKRKTERVGIGDLMAASALMETHEFGKEMEHVVDYLANFGKGKGNSTYCAQFATSLMVHRSYCLSFKWLLDWEPKPLVKMNFMAQHGEAIGVDLNSVSPSLCCWMPKAFGYYLKSLGSEGHVQWTSAMEREDRVHAVISEELGWFIVEEEATISIKKALTISGNEFDSSNSFYQHIDVASFVKSSNLGEETIENLGKQLDLNKRRLPRVMRGLCADECYGVFKFAEDAAILQLCGFSKLMKEPKAAASSLFLMHSTFALEDLLHFETKELNVSFSPTASGHFGNVEEMANKLDNLLEDIERLAWVLASLYASSSIYRSLKRLSVRFPRPMVKMKLTKYVGKSQPKSWRRANSALKLRHKYLLIIAFDVAMRDQWLNCWRLDFLPSLRTRKL